MEEVGFFMKLNFMAYNPAPVPDEAFFSTQRCGGSWLHAAYCQELYKAFPVTMPHPLLDHTESSPP